MVISGGVIDRLLFGDDMALRGSQVDDLHHDVDGRPAECCRAEMRISVANTRTLAQTRKFLLCILHVSKEVSCSRDSRREHEGRTLNWMSELRMLVQKRVSSIT